MIDKSLSSLFVLVIVIAFARFDNVDSNSGNNSLQSNVISEQDFVHKEKDSLSEDIGLGWSGNHAGESRGEISRGEGCRSANFCCQGKDNKCFARGRKVNGGRGEICYCDSQCLTLNDCCWDYKENCPGWFMLNLFRLI